MAKWNVGDDVVVEPDANGWGGGRFAVGLAAFAGILAFVVMVGWARWVEVGRWTAIVTLVAWAFGRFAGPPPGFYR